MRVRADRFRWVGIAYLAGLAALGGLGVISPQIDADLNAVIPMKKATLSDRSTALHDTLRVVDLHADMLLWDRNHRARQGHGHTDMVRLREGAVELQVFSTVTGSPKGQNFDQNNLQSGDQITTLALAQGWPIATWGSMRARAVHQAERLVALERAGELRIVRTRSDLSAPGLKGILLTEGAHPLEGDLANIEHLYDVGYRVMGLQHFFDNELGGSMHGVSQGGLTEFGRAAVMQMAARGIIIDLAHSSEAVARDVLAMIDAPVMVSHSGLRSACPRTSNRNLPDDVLVEIARRGGVVGVAYFEGAICDITPTGIASTIAAAITVLGVDGVALGSDFDGTVTTRIDTSELDLITEALMAQGVSEANIRAVMGENALRFFADNLPD